MSNNENGTEAGKIIELRPANDRGGPAAMERVSAERAAASEPAINLPPAVKALCVAMIAAFCIQQLISEEMNAQLVTTLGFVPARYSGHADFIWGAAAAPLTYMFLHGGWLHLISNIAMLMAFGAGIEKYLGLKRFLIIFTVSGLVGALGQFLVTPSNDMPLIGASGGISGLFGAVMMLLYRRGALGDSYKSLVPMVAAFVLFSAFFGFFGMPGAEGSIAWIVHIAGFFAGFGAYLVMMVLQKR